MIPAQPAEIEQIEGYMAVDGPQALLGRSLRARTMVLVREVGSYSGKTTI